MRMLRDLFSRLFPFSVAAVALLHRQWQTAENIHSVQLVCDSLNSFNSSEHTSLNAQQLIIPAGVQ